MNQKEHLITCLAEEGGEAALELSKVAHKTNRFGASDRNVLNPDGPTNIERLVNELNDLIAVVDMLVDEHVIPADWFSLSKQREKREKVIKFMEYARSTGALA